MTTPSPARPGPAQTPPPATPPASLDPTPGASPAPPQTPPPADNGTAATAAPAAKGPGRAGRDLRAAVGVGLILAAIVIGSLVFRKEAFLVVLLAAVVVGTWEMWRALSSARINAPIVPLVLGAVSMVLAAEFTGPEGLVVAFGLTTLGLLIWRIADGVAGAARDLGGALLVALYPGFLGGFASLLLSAPDGHRRILVFIITTVFSDIGGYAVGVLAGKHPMAPTVSPKKSWEGFGGSVAACAVAGSLSLHFLLGGALWQGALLGVLLAGAATFGDLVESLVKRDLGLKDMGSLLPGHGGLMDRLDSLVIALPITWAFLLWAVPLP